jgi:hypothetical protein
LLASSSVDLIKILLLRCHPSNVTITVFGLANDNPSTSQYPPNNDEIEIHGDEQADVLDLMLL